MAELKTMKLYKDDSFIIVNVADVAKYKKLGFSLKPQELKAPDYPPSPVITEDDPPISAEVVQEKLESTKTGKPMSGKGVLAGSDAK